MQIRVTDTNLLAVNATSLSVTSNYTLTVNEVNLATTLIPLANRVIHAGTTLSVGASATDPDLPANTFTYGKVSGPASVTVNAAGLVTWNTSDTDANTTNVIVLKVSDNGVPNLSNTNSFVVTVGPQLRFTSITKTGSVATVVWSAIPEAGYRVQYKTNLDATSWSDVIGDVIATGTTASKADAMLGTNAMRFYRVLALP